MDNKIILFSVIGVFLFLICQELHRQNIPVIKVPPKKMKKTQQEIQIEEVKKSKEGNDFIFPEITTITQPLTQFINEILDPDLKEIDGTPIKVIRNNTLKKKEQEANKVSEKITPKPTDIVTPNPIDTSEYYFVGEDTSNAWSETNVSQHPTYHTSSIGEELTQVGGFFDANNEYHDQTSPSAKTHLPDRCFMNDNKEVLCKFNNRLHNIPPKLIDNKQENKLLQSIGQGKGDIFKPISSDNIENVNETSYQVWNYDNEKTNNGGEFYENVYPSSGNSSEYLVMDNLPKGSYSF
jgi:hypothetical protein